MRQVELVMLVLNAIYVGFRADRGDWGWVAFNGAVVLLLMVALWADNAIAFWRRA